MTKSNFFVFSHSHNYFHIYLLRVFLNLLAGFWMLIIQCVLYKVKTFSVGLESVTEDNLTPSWFHISSTFIWSSLSVLVLSPYLFHLCTAILVFENNLFFQFLLQFQNLSLSKNASLPMTCGMRKSKHIFTLDVVACRH